MNWNELPINRTIARHLPAKAIDPAPRRLMDHYPSEFDAIHHRERVEDWVLSTLPNFWLTLSYQHSFSAIHSDYIDAHESMDRFMDRICKKAYGRRMVSKVVRPSAFAFLEHARTNKHFNLLLDADKSVERAIRHHGESIWRKVAPRSAGFHIERIENREKVVSYCNKEQLALGPYSSMYVYSKNAELK